MNKKTIIWGSILLVTGVVLYKSQILADREGLILKWIKSKGLDDTTQVRNILSSKSKYQLYKEINEL